MGSALVTDARLIMALPIIRSLGKTGVEVIAMESASGKHRFIPGFYSRYVSKRVLCTDLSTGLLTEGKNVDVVFPVSGDAVYALARMSPGSTLAAKAALPQPSSIEIANDKMRLNELAERLGVPVPKTYHPELHVDLGAPDSKVWAELESWSRDLPFPVMIKYRYGEGLHLPASQRYRLAGNAEEFVRNYMGIHTRQALPLVQEYIPGEDYGAAILCDRTSKVVASFTYRSIRQRPRVGGPTTRAESCSYPAMVAHLGRVAEALSWYGMAMGDFRKTPDGQFRLLEINPRFWGSLALAVEAGVNFPLLYYDLVANKGYLGSSSPVQKDGMCLKFSFQDALAIVEYAKNSPQPWLYIIREMGGLIAPGVKDAVFEVKDPKPGIAYLLNHLS